MTQVNFYNKDDPAGQFRIFDVVRSWGTKSRLNVVEYVWILSMFGLLAGLEDYRIGLYLIPPFGATLSILLGLPDAPVAQPYALVTGSVVGATVGAVNNPLASTEPHAAPPQP